MEKKILHIQVLPKLSGAQRISLEIFKALPNDQYEKWILFSDLTDFGNREQCQREFEAAGAKVVYSSKMKRSIGWADFFAIIELYRLCRLEKFDIVHTHSTKPGIIGRIAAMLAQVPLVVHTVHGLAFHKFIKFPKWQFYWACEMFASLFCHKIVLVNNYYSRYFKWFKRKTITIYNGIDFSALPPVKKQPNDFPKILFVGRLDEPKDPITLLQTAQLVLEKYPQTRFTLVGDGEKYDECKEFIQEHGMQHQVILEGWQNDVSKYYGTHDIFFAPSIYESFGLMFVEAGFYKLPSVTTNVEGIPEVIENGVNGLTCGPKDHNTMAKNIISLIENDCIRVKMGNSAHDRMTTRFSTINMTNQYKYIYNAN